MPGRPNLVLRALLDEHGLDARTLADTVNTAGETLTGTPGNATDRHVRRWLSGEVTCPQARYVHALAHVLDVPTNGLGFTLGASHLRSPASTLVPGTPPDQEDTTPVLRRRFIAAATANAFGLARAPFPTRGRITATDVERVRESVDRLHALDDAHGGDTLTDVAHTWVRRITDAMDHCVYGPAVETALHRVRSQLNACAGWFAYDCGDQPRAARLYDAALRDALLADDRTLQARVWSYMARQSWDLGRAAETVTIARTALSATRGSGRDPRLSALLHARMALGYAAAGQSARFAASMTRADTHLDKTTDTPPAWLAFVGGGELLGTAAMAHMALGRPAHAAHQEEQAMTLLDPRFRRNRYAKLVHLSECHLVAGDLEQALHAAGQALDLQPDVRCARWHVRLRRLRDTTARIGTPHTRAFVDRYDTLV